jgi:hypothetical protein
MLAAKRFGTRIGSKDFPSRIAGNPATACKHLQKLPAFTVGDRFLFALRGFPGIPPVAP